MKIEHIAIWVNDLDNMADFYARYFGGIAGEKYHNPSKQFTSRFVSFGDGCRLELMHRPDISSKSDAANSIGITHFAISVESKEAVRELTERLRTDGHTIFSEPRTTGDGYYESVIADPEGNTVEIIA